ncbi:MAG TPA: hypothetical protein VGF53_09285 [Pseudolabrys sp.]|jgi:hypothetical protein
MRFLFDTEGTTPNYGNIPKFYDPRHYAVWGFHPQLDARGRGHFYNLGSRSRAGPIKLRIAPLDKQFADAAVRTRERARYLHSTRALRTINILKEDIGSGPDVENERAAACMAISAFSKTLLETPNSPEIQTRWQIAIDRTKAWYAALK